MTNASSALPLCRLGNKDAAALEYGTSKRLPIGVKECSLMATKEPPMCRHSHRLVLERPR